MEPVSDPLLDLLRNRNLPPATGPRPTEDLFEVHFWPYTGRIMTIHLDPDGGAQTTDLRIVGTGGHGSKHLSDQTAALAEHLADTSNPQGSLAEHWADGHVIYLWDRTATGPGDGQDLTFRLEPAGITLPAPTYTATNPGTFTAGARHATLLRYGTPIGVITATDAGHLDLGPLEAGTPAADLTAELAEFAGTCRDRDGLPVTLSELLAALLDSHQETR